MKKRSRSSPLLPDAEATDIEVYQFQCGHEECGSELTAASRDKLLLLIAQHLREAHSVDKVTNTLLGYLESTCVTVLLP